MNMFTFRQSLSQLRSFPQADIGYNLLPDKVLRLSHYIPSGMPPKPIYQLFVLCNADGCCKTSFTLKQNLQQIQDLHTSSDIKEKENTHTAFFTLHDVWTAISRYGPILKLATSGHETWPKANVPEVPRVLTFYPRGLKLSVLSLYRQ